MRSSHLVSSVNIKSKSNDCLLNDNGVEVNGE